MGWDEERDPNGRRPPARGGTGPDEEPADTDDAEAADPRADDAPPPPGWAGSGPTERSAPRLELVGFLGLAFSAGMLGCFLAQDLLRGAEGRGFSGVSLILSGILGVFFVAPAALCFFTGRRLCRVREQPLSLPDARRWGLAAVAVVLGAAVAVAQGLPGAP